MAIGVTSGRAAGIIPLIFPRADSGALIKIYVALAPRRFADKSSSIAGEPRGYHRAAGSASFCSLDDASGTLATEDSRVRADRRSSARRFGARCSLRWEPSRVSVACWVDSLTGFPDFMINPLSTRELFR